MALVKGRGGVKEETKKNRKQKELKDKMEKKYENWFKRNPLDRSQWNDHVGEAQNWGKNQIFRGKNVNKENLECNF